MMLITIGDQGYPEIFRLQRILKFLGLYPLEIDGHYGYATAKATMLFQEQNDLKVDGIVGPMTIAKLEEKEAALNLIPVERTYSIDDILRTYETLNYDLHEEQYKINLLGIRKDDIFDNMFTDRLVIFWKNENREWEKSDFEWTTMPGTEGKGVFNPIQVMGITGTAVLVAGQYKDTWRLYDTYTGWLRYPFFQQEQEVKVYRDGNRDTILDKYMPEQVGLFGINIHRMSGNGQHQRYVNSQYVTWSMGCQGAPEPVFRKIVDLARISSKYHSNVFTYTLIDDQDFARTRGETLKPGYFTAFND